MITLNPNKMNFDAEKIGELAVKAACAPIYGFLWVLNKLVKEVTPIHSNDSYDFFSDNTVRPRKKLPGYFNVPKINTYRSGYVYCFKSKRYFKESIPPSPLNDEFK